MSLFIIWDPPKEIFTIPVLNWPLTWYGFLFALGFFWGYYIVLAFWKRYLLYFPLSLKDIEDFIPFCKLAKRICHKESFSFDSEKTISQKQALSCYNQYLSKEKGLKNRMKLRFGFEKELGNSLTSLKKKAQQITDRLLIYVMIATVVGARLGHIIFYEDVREYFLNPGAIFGFGRGGIAGLASHGAAIAIIIALLLFKRAMKKSFSLDLSLSRILDMVALPTAFAAFFIRIGNFINQEIIGIPTSLPWGVLFLHPAGGELVIPRHPAQLYEALFYLFVFSLLFYFSFKPKFFLKDGRFTGLFLLLIFSFRFVVEFLKVEQSEIICGSLFTMGQYLSLPFIALGLFFLFKKDKKKGCNDS